MIVTDEAAELALAWQALKAALPDAPLVKITLRRKTGQVLCTVGRINRTGTSDAEAIRKVAEALR